MHKVGPICLSTFMTWKCCEKREPGQSPGIKSKPGQRIDSVVLIYVNNAKAKGLVEGAENDIHFYDWPKVFPDRQGFVVFANSLWTFQLRVEVVHSTSCIGCCSATISIYSAVVCLFGKRATVVASENYNHCVQENKCEGGKHPTFANDIA